MKHSGTGFLRLALVVVLSLIFTTLSYGQKGKGVVTGTVTDPTGSTVPSATVTLVNVATGISRTDRTNTSGLYAFQFVDVGSYALRIQSQGFATFEVPDLVVTVDQTVVANAKMQMAKSTTTVTVEAGGVQLVDTSNAEVSGLVNR